MTLVLVQNLEPNEIRVNGQIYRQQYRRCSKAGCQCQVEGSKGHGPYWYSYGPAGIRYIGRELPAAVTRVRTHRVQEEKALLKIMAREERKARKISDALDRQSDRISTVREILEGSVPDPRIARAMGLTRFILREAK